MEKSSALIVASNFPPVQSAGVYRTLRLAKYLPDLQWQLRVLTISTNTLLPGTKTDPDLLAQVDESLSIYRAPARFPIETFNRITGRSKRKKNADARATANSTAKVNGEWPNRKHSSAGRLQRFKDQLTLPFMTPDRLVGWVRPAAKLGTTVVKQNQTDVIYSSGPAWSNHLVAQRITAKTSTAWVADFRDPWVGNAFRSHRSEGTWVGRKHQRLERNVYEQADVVIFNTDRARIDAVERTGDFLAVKSVVIPNGFDPEHFEGLTRANTSSQTSLPGQDTPLRMLHAGSFYGKRNIDAFLQAIGEQKQAGNLTAEIFQLQLIGSVRQHERALIAQHSIDDLVTLTPAMPHRDCLQQLAYADILLLVQTDAPLCVPGKLYEYVAAGKPIFTLAGDGATADLAERENLGPCVDPNNPSQITDALTGLVSQYQNGKMELPSQLVRARFDGQQQMELFDQAFHRAIESKRSQGSTDEKDQVK